MSIIPDSFVKKFSNMFGKMYYWNDNLKEPIFKEYMFTKTDDGNHKLTVLVYKFFENNIKGIIGGVTDSFKLSDRRVEMTDNGRYESFKDNGDQETDVFYLESEVELKSFDNDYENICNIWRCIFHGLGGLGKEVDEEGGHVKLLTLGIISVKK